MGLAEIIDDEKKLYKHSVVNKCIELTFTVKELISDIYLDGEKIEQIIGNLGSKDRGWGIPDKKFESMLKKIQL